MEVRGFRVRTGKGSRDICMLTSQDVANYIIEHYESGQKDEVTIKPLTEQETAKKERYLS